MKGWKAIRVIKSIKNFHKQNWRHVIADYLEIMTVKLYRSILVFSELHCWSSNNGKGVGSTKYVIALCDPDQTYLYAMLTTLCVIANLWSKNKNYTNHYVELRNRIQYLYQLMPKLTAFKIKCYIHFEYKRRLPLRMHYQKEWVSNNQLNCYFCQNQKEIIKVAKYLKKINL